MIISFDYEPPSTSRPSKSFEQIKTELLDLYDKLIHPHLKKDSKSKELNNAIIFSTLEHYESSTVKSLCYTDSRIAKLHRYQRERQYKRDLNLLLDKAADFIPDRELAEIKYWNEFILGSTHNDGIFLEYTLENLANDITTTRDGLATAMHDIANQAHQLKIKLKKLSRSMAATLENHYLAAIRAINTAQNRTEINARSLLISLLYDPIASLTEEQKQQYLPRILNLLSPVFNLIDYLDRAIADYEKLAKKWLQLLQDMHHVMDDYPAELILYIAKNNQSIHDFLEQGSFKDWCLTLLEKISADTSIQTKIPNNISVLDLALQVQHFYSSQALQPLLDYLPMLDSLPKGRGKLPAKRLKDFIIHLKSTSLNPFDLYNILLLHNEIRTKLYQDTDFLSAQAINTLVTSTHQPDLSELFPLSEEMKDAYYFPQSQASAYMNACLNKMSAGYFLLQQSKAKQDLISDEENQILKQASLCYFLSAIPDLKAAKNLARQAERVYPTTSRFFSPQNLTSYLPDQILNWQNAEAQFQNFISATFKINVKQSELCDLEPNINRMSGYS